jgi:hypothetical protein
MPANRLADTSDRHRHETMTNPNSVTPRRAVVLGAVLAAGGIVPILAGSGLIPVQPTDGTPGWIVVCAGAVFVLGGAAVINGFAIAGGTAPDGDLPANTPLVVRLAQYVFGLAIIALLTIISGWIAFGPGERRFSTTIVVPFAPWRSSGSGLSGRIAFGVGTLMLAAILVTSAFAVVRRLCRTGRSSRPDQDVRTTQIPLPLHAPPDGIISVRPPASTSTPQRKAG